MRSGRAARRVPHRRALCVALRGALLAAVAAAFCSQAVGPAFSSGAAEPYWQLPTAGTLGTGPIAGRKYVYAASEDWRLYSVEKNGQIRWRLFLGQKPLGMLSEALDGTVYVFPSASELWAVNPGGIVIFSLALPEPARYPALSGPDGRFFIATDSSLLCYAARGSFNWKLPLPSPPSCAPILLDSGGVALGLADGSLLLFDGLGRRPASFSAGGAPSALAARGRRVACFAGASLLLVDEGGAARPAIALPGRIAAACAVPEGAGSASPVAFGCALEDGSIVALDAVGKALWSAPAGKDGRVALAFLSSRLVRSGATEASAFGLDGKLLSVLSVTGGRDRIVVDAGGLAFSGGEDWILYCYRIPLGPPSAAPAAPSYGLGSTIDADPFREFSDPERRKSLLDSVEKSAISGTIGEGEAEASRALATIAASAVRTMPPAGDGKFTAGPVERARAALCLGILGSGDTRPLLVELYLKDQDPLVKAAAARALSMLGGDPGGTALGAFLATMAGRGPEEEVAEALCDSALAMARYSGGEGVPACVRLLSAIAQRPYGGSVRDKAMKALDYIAGFGLPRK